MNLIDILDKYLLEEESRERKGHYPSDALSCGRQLYYKWNNITATDPPTPGQLLKMKYGKIIHNWALNALKKSGLNIIIENDDIDGESLEFFVQGLKYPIRYRLDGRFVDFAGYNAVIEVKTSYGAGIKAVQEEGPRPEEFAQCTIYMAVLHCQRVYLIYLGRDNGYRFQRILEAEVSNDLFREDGLPIMQNFMIDGLSVDQNSRYKMKLGDKVVPIRIEHMIEKFKLIEEFLESGELPPRDYLAAIKDGAVQNKYTHRGKIIKCWRCSYCYWKRMCWEPELQKYRYSNNAEEHEKKTPEGWVLE